MGNKILVLLFVLLVGTISCQKVRNPIERNILSFESAIDSVIDAMDRINLILNNSIDDEYISIII
nr:hypothetical protein [Candidatus Kapabacteria bacterium]